MRIISQNDIKVIKALETLKIIRCKMKLLNISDREKFSFYDYS